MSYRIDINKDKNSFLPSISIKKKSNKPDGIDYIAPSVGATSGYLLGSLFTTRAFEDATTKAIQNKANSLYESAGRRLPRIIEEYGKDVKGFDKLKSQTKFITNLMMASAESKLGEKAELGLKKHTTPMGRFGKRLSAAISGGLLAHLIIKKLYE